MNHVPSCVCLFTRPAARERERERWHIRPGGTSLLESLASLPFSPFPSPPLSRSLLLCLFLTLPDPMHPIAGVVEGQTERPSCGSFRTGQRSSCSLIKPWYNAIFLSKYSHINSFHNPLKIQRVRSFTSQCPSTIQHDAGFNNAAKCAKSPWLNGNLVGINST